MFDMFYQMWAQMILYIKSAAQQSFQPVKAQRKMHNLISLLSKVQCNFRNELFDSVKAQRNSAIAERHFCSLPS